MKDINPEFLGVNQNVLAKARCSVGIFIDRGFSTSLSMEPQSSMSSFMELWSSTSSSFIESRSSNFNCRIAVLFVLGCDDREALSYAWRMASHPGVSLDVIRFIPGEDFVNNNNDESLNVLTNYEREKKLDDTYIKEFRLKTKMDEAITYSEKVVNSGVETIGKIKAMKHNCDLYIVGKEQGAETPLTKGLSEWTDNPELGAIGDLLVSSEFATSVSVLVVQQYTAGYVNDVLDISEGSSHRREPLNSFGHMTWRLPVESTGAFEPSVHCRGI